MSKQLKELFQPIQVGNLVLKNRIVMVAMEVGLGKEDGTVDQKLIDYYVERARGGVGLIITGVACVDSPEGKGTPGEMVVDDDKYIPGLRSLAKAVHAEGAKIFLQLCHAGRNARSKVTGMQPVAPSPVYSPYTKETPRELSTREVEAIIEKFAQATRRAKEAGFDGVELLGGSGYLVSQFLSSFTNRRTDRFGGDPAARTTFVREIIQAARELVGQDFPICCRISAVDFLPEGNTIEDGKIIARKLEEAGVDLLNVWAGWHESPVPMLPMSVKRGAFVYIAEEIKKVVNIPVITVGRINDPCLAAQIISEKKADLVGMGRAFLADPYLPKKAAAGELEDVRMCIACVRCLESIMSSIETGRAQPVVCTVNAELGREGEKKVTLAEKPKRVLIIGGGPAGMEAARVAALRGHQVTLWEKRNKLGGNLILAAIPPYKEEINNLTAYLTYQMKKLGVKVELNKEATPEDILEEKAEEVVIATGSIPKIPDLPGVERENVVTAIDALIEKERIGERVVVDGGGWIGCEVSEFLAQKGKKVTLLSRRKGVGMDIGQANRWVILKRLREAGVEMITSIQVKSITSEGVVIEKEGETKTLQADTVVLARGFAPDRKLYDTLQDKLPRLHLIGDSFEVNTILEAIHSGWELGCAL